MTDRSPTETLGTRRDRGYYVYCIVETEERLDLGPLGIGEENSPVYSVHDGGLAAVVSEAPLRRYQPTRENLLAHELVNETVMSSHTMIPMSFGTMFRTEDDIVALLRSTGPTLTEVLATVRGKVELGLKVVWNRERVLAAIESENDSIRRLKEEIIQGGNGSAYTSRVRFGRLVERALEERANELRSNVYEPLRPLAVASRSKKPLDDNMLLNVAFLVERVRDDEFDRAVGMLSTRYQDVLSFSYTGPWPPYNFVDVKLKFEPVD